MFVNMHSLLQSGLNIIAELQIILINLHGSAIRMAMGLTKQVEAFGTVCSSIHGHLLCNINNLV